MFRRSTRFIFVLFCGGDILPSIVDWLCFFTDIRQGCFSDTGSIIMPQCQWTLENMGQIGISHHNIELIVHIIWGCVSWKLRCGGLHGERWIPLTYKQQFGALHFFFGVSRCKLLNKQSSGRWFEKPVNACVTSPSWVSCNVLFRRCRCLVWFGDWAIYQV